MRLATLVEDEVIHRVVVSLGKYELVGRVSPAGHHTGHGSASWQARARRRPGRSWGQGDARVMAFKNAMDDGDVVVRHLVDDDVTNLEWIVSWH